MAVLVISRYTTLLRWKPWELTRGRHVTNFVGARITSSCPLSRLWFGPLCLDEMGRSFATGRPRDNWARRARAPFGISLRVCALSCNFAGGRNASCFRRNYAGALQGRSLTRQRHCGGGHDGCSSVCLHGHCVRSGCSAVSWAKAFHSGTVRAVVEHHGTSVSNDHYRVWMLATSILG